MKWQPLLLMLCLCLGCIWIYQTKSPHFDPKNIYEDFSHEFATQFPHELKETFNKPFYFIGEGAQIYAFRSQDGKTVLKLFKAHHTPHTSLLKKCLRACRNAEERFFSQKKWQLKCTQTCQRYQMAFEDLIEETGLHYLHFKKSKRLPLKVRLIDNNRHAFEMDLNHYPFIVQKYAKLVPDYLKEMIDTQQLDKAQQAISSLKDLFLKRTEKGYIDPRQSLRINYGFSEGKAVQIDVGKLEKTSLPISKKQEESAHLEQRVDSWIRK